MVKSFLKSEINVVKIVQLFIVLTLVAKDLQDEKFTNIFLIYYTYLKTGIIIDIKNPTKILFLIRLTFFNAS